MKVLLLGANGQLGTDLHRVLATQGHTVIPTIHAELDICDSDKLHELIVSSNCDVVINTAAFHKVEACEEQAARAFQVNALGARNLARACAHRGCVLVHFSTDYVFDGRQRKPYAEDDLPRPLNVYGVSKLAGEHLIAASSERYFVIRTCGLYGIAGSGGKGGNFVENMLKKAWQGVPLRVVNDQVLTPTFTVDLAEAVNRLIRTREYGLYHITSEGECSWYTFAKTIFEFEKLKVDLTPVSTDEFPSPVKRPLYSVLRKQRLQKVGLSMPAWKDGLGRYLAARHILSRPAAITP
ncbi:MAG: dTDP-4-dehydrorhamnose reductase [Acidobacteriia bacterium]|nr:dTDP-4-dehydrorhamnose reductase [Terriglobia bacterium]